jgi:hypothetical protein
VKLQTCGRRREHWRRGWLIGELSWLVGELTWLMGEFR